MLEWQWRGITLRLSLLFPAAVIAMLSFDTTGMAALCLWAALLHEGGHAAAMLAVGDCPSRVCFGVFGVRVERSTRPLGYGRCAAVSLAGPLVNAVCCGLLWRWGQPQAALIHGVLAGFHLLPVSALDGGEAVYALLCLKMEEQRAHRVLLWASAMVLLPLSAAGFYLLLQTGYNFSLLLLAGYLILLLIFKEKH